MLESNTLYVNDENGNEMELEILFTFENDEIGKKICGIRRSAG